MILIIPIMKTISFMAFSLVAILLATVGILSTIILPQNSFAQSNNNNTAMAGVNTTNNNSTTMMDGNQSTAMVKDYQKYDRGQKHEKINGTINMMNTMYQALGSKFNVNCRTNNRKWLKCNVSK
jgi:hypothetical protein